MRIIRTFVLRLLIDTDEPERLRGSLRSILNDSEYPFADEQALLGLLSEHFLNLDARDELEFLQQNNSDNESS